ncbi:MAG: hypothetical protein AAFV59_06400 [Pseudomonadota bacterium]
MIFDNDPKTFPDDDPKREDAIIEEWFEIIEAGLGIEASKTGSDAHQLAEELERAKTALRRARSKTSG